MDYNIIKGSATLSGTDTLTGTLTVSDTAYTDNGLYLCKIASNNVTATPTLNLNSIGALTIYNTDGAALSVGQLRANSWVLFQYNASGTRFYAINAPITTDLLLAKEVNHVISVDTSTTAATVGGTLTLRGGIGATSGNGGPVAIAGGVGGATAASVGGAVTITSGVSGAGGGASGAITASTGAGTTSTGAINITTGNASAGGSGNIVLTAGTASTVVGHVIARSLLVQPQGAPAAKTTSTTLTAAELLTGIITVNQGGGATSSLTLPTGTAIDAAVSMAVGDSFEFSVINISTVAAEDADILVNTDVTIVGSAAIQSNDAITSKSSGRFRARKTATNTFIVYRLS